MFSSIIKKSYDLHFHVGPEVIPRKYSIANLIKEEQNNIAGIGVKNHMFTTAFSCKDNSNSDLEIIYSITLNGYIGGINPLQVKATADILTNRFIVWFPTIHSATHLSKHKYEIPKEWVNKSNFISESSNNIKPITIIENGNLKPSAIKVLKIIKDNDAILATGHISFMEAKLLVDKASYMGIKRIIITHPIYNIQKFSIKEQKYLVNKGAYIEICEAMYSIDKISIEDIVLEMKQVGYKNYILSSDGGQRYSLLPSVILNKFAKLLYRNGIKYSDLKIIFENSKKLVSK